MPETQEARSQWAGLFAVECVGQTGFWDWLIVAVQRINRLASHASLGLWPRREMRPGPQPEGVTHVGMIARGCVLEAIGISAAQSGVVQGDIAAAAARYRGLAVRVWYLPAAEPSGALTAYDRALRHRGEAYDYKGALEAGLDVFEAWGWGRAAKENRVWFCSKLVGEAWGDSNWEELTPSDVVRKAGRWDLAAARLLYAPAE